MLGILASSSADKTLVQSTSIFKQVTNNLFAGNSLWVLIASLVVALLAGKIVSTVLRQVSRGFGRRADAASNLASVNRLRRLETWTILSIAILRVLFVIFGLYFWWAYVHPDNRPSGIIGASALLAIVLGGVVGPLLRDFAFGSGMMAEHWFGVGDLITIVPFNDIQGVVERITLRSIRIRGLNGEVIWIANQNIAAVRVAQKGVWTMAIELFATDPKKAEALIEQTNALLPHGPALVARELGVMSATQRAKDLWHVTAIGETAPGREWLLERTAIDLLKQLDERSKTPTLITDPVARYADSQTEHQFARAINNAKKTRRAPRTIKLGKPPKKTSK